MASFICARILINISFDLRGFDKISDLPNDPDVEKKYLIYTRLIMLLRTILYNTYV